MIITKTKNDTLYEFYITISGTYISLNIYKIPIRPSRTIKEDVDLINIRELNTAIFNFIYER